MNYLEHITLNTKLLFFLKEAGDRFVVDLHDEFPATLVLINSLLAKNNTQALTFNGGIHNFTNEELPASNRQTKAALEKSSPKHLLDASVRRTTGRLAFGRRKTAEGQGTQGMNETGL